MLGVWVVKEGVGRTLSMQSTWYMSFTVKVGMHSYG